MILAFRQQEEEEEEKEEEEEEEEEEEDEDEEEEEEEEEDEVFLKRVLCSVHTHPLLPIHSTTLPKKLKRPDDSPGGNGAPAVTWTHMGDGPRGPGQLRPGSSAQPA